MGRGFSILRSMVFVFIFSLVLAFIPLAVYQGDFITSLFISIGMFVSSVIVATVLMAIFKRG